jgi:hypothetical protein
MHTKKALTDIIDIKSYRKLCVNGGVTEDQQNSDDNVNEASDPGFHHRNDFGLLPMSNRIDGITLFYPITRVTRLGEFSPIEQLFTQTSFCENCRNKANFGGYFFHATSVNID